MNLKLRKPPFYIHQFKLQKILQLSFRKVLIFRIIEFYERRDIATDEIFLTVFKVIYSIVSLSAESRVSADNSILRTLKSEKERGDNGLFITLVPTVL